LPKRYWRRKSTGEQETTEGRVSEQELLNRVVLAKALQVYASNQTLHLKTKDEDFEITPRVAKDVMKASGQWPSKRLKKGKKRRKKALLR
jgi:uncharacterized membrane protein YsdA (DUF1294 family)